MAPKICMQALLNKLFPSVTILIVGACSAEAIIH